MPTVTDVGSGPALPAPPYPTPPGTYPNGEPADIRALADAKAAKK